jgi:ABC-type dipeptide transport system, periplasmic component
MRGSIFPAGITNGPGGTGYTKELDERLPYEVDAAKQLLADAGYPEGIEEELRRPNDRYVNEEAICTAVGGRLGKIGVKVSLLAQTKSKHHKELKENQGDLHRLGRGAPTTDSHHVPHNLYETGASWNKANFSDTEGEAARRGTEGEANREKRKAATAKARKIVKDNTAQLPSHHQVMPGASKRRAEVPTRPTNEPVGRRANERERKP